MKENLTEIAFILDRSGSMASMQEEAVGGFNAFIEKQKKEPGTAQLSLLLFDHEYLPTIPSTNLLDVPELTEADYVPRGTTALLDAMGRTIDDMGKRLAGLPDSERPENVIVVTLTDGLENASQDYTQSKVAEMIKLQRDKYKWEFLFLGADVEAVEYAKHLNVEPTHSMEYKKGKGGIHASMQMSHQFISERRRRTKSG